MYQIPCGIVYVNFFLFQHRKQCLLKQPSASKATRWTMKKHPKIKIIEWRTYKKTYYQFHTGMAKKKWISRRVYVGAGITFILGVDVMVWRGPGTSFFDGAILKHYIFPVEGILHYFYSLRRPFDLDFLLTAPAEWLLLLLLGNHYQIRTIQFLRYKIQLWKTFSIKCCDSIANNLHGFIYRERIVHDPRVR